MDMAREADAKEAPICHIEPKTNNLFKGIFHILLVPRKTLRAITLSSMQEKRTWWTGTTPAGPTFLVGARDQECTRNMKAAIDIETGHAKPIKTNLLLLIKITKVLVLSRWHTTIIPRTVCFLVTMLLYCLSPEIGKAPITSAFRGASTAKVILI